MAAQKKGLGRGLDALLGPVNTQPPEITKETAAIAPQPVAPDQISSPRVGLKTIPLDLLQPGTYQPRRDMHRETLEELAESIKTQGVLAPISVRPIASGGGATRYEIIAGERRWRASQMAGLDEIPVVIRDVDDEGAAAIALIENLQREDLNPLEEAEGLKRLIDEFELTHQEAATAVGKSRTAVSNLLRLLDLASEALQLLASGELDMGHARALLALSGDRSQTEAAHQVVARGLSVRDTEALVRRLQAGKSAKASVSKVSSLDPDIRRLQDDLSQKLAAKVAIQHTAKGKGKLVISYNSVDELDGILDRIK
ncbi:MAG: ParB/RepB/Spo0J family partition protein [Gammaproteobacteria bacterium]|nr:ParB/RepB/Spo0J family partition protein [Gammaproteobacteria bacterium]MCP4090158.1 ParB/RepB/Spo0J family partition protein [Gammaproteobacteria bacterium]MCP4277928.1 ParB/RepB/Spo0J family partition protein [Gammaproteobacteria bacterium]MCP4832523.1 ParB/RepB/Spo0J family partition protein [Gammaproteobacteria bacterium]MCP4928695.1 ParB/RepB/Spo0J family partition protein [Gammaproteobacteria bacterium]